MILPRKLRRIRKPWKALLQLDCENVPDELVRNIFRAVHSIKGTAGFFELNNIVALSHAMENLFGALRDRTLSYRVEMMDVLLQANDRLRQLIDAVEDSDRQDITAVIGSLWSFLPVVLAASAEMAATLVERVSAQSAGSRRSTTGITTGLRCG